MCRRRKYNLRVTSRAGLTLIELLMSVAIMGIMAGAMSMLAISVQQSSAYNEGRGTALQHARVVFERINRVAGTAATAPAHPGMGVVITTSGANQYPDTLVIWTPPNGVPVNPAGPPLVKEVTIYCPDPSNPSQFVEITAPSDSSTIALDATLNTTAGQAQVAAIKTAATSQKVMLTDLLRTANASVSGSTTVRGAVRFNLELHPTASEYNSYVGGSLSWTNMAWAQGLYSSSYGIRQVWLRTELQLMPKNLRGKQDTSGQLPMPFFNSTTIYYQMNP